jgi:hypothetical protein
VNIQINLWVPLLLEVMNVVLRLCKCSVAALCEFFSKLY